MVDALVSGLELLGIGGFYGEPVPGAPVLAVPNEAVAAVLEAHAHVLGSAACLHQGEGRFLVGRGIGGDGPPVPVLEIDHPGALPAALAEVSRRSTEAGAVTALHLRVEPGAPAPDDPVVPMAVPERWGEPPAEAGAALVRAQRPVVLAGPGVPAGGFAPALHELAAAGSLGVLNTWGAKGVFDWRSRYHWATVGLQRDDLRRGGFADSDLVLTSGLDRAETPADVDAFAPVIDVAPAALSRLAEQGRRPDADFGVPPLRADLARVTQRGWERRTAPLAPSAVTRNYGQVTAGRGFVAADPGPTGFWVARTFPTTVPGEAKVPGDGPNEGFAVAAALVANRAGVIGPVVAACDGPLGEVGRALFETARRGGVPVVVECWEPGGPALDPPGHLARLRTAVWSGRPELLALSTDGAQLVEMETVAGPVTAWRTDGGDR